MNKRAATAAEPDLPYQAGARMERRLAKSAAQFGAATDNLNQIQSPRNLARIHFKKLRFAALAVALVLPTVIRAGENGTTDFAVLRRPLSKVEALTIAIARNGTILQAKKEVEAATGIAIQTKAIVYPRVEQRLQAFGGYELTSKVGSRNAGDELHGGLVGVRLSWAVFDGFLTKGRVVEAVARRGKAREAKAETARQVELQVRTAWSDLRTAQRSLEISQARHNEGVGTQLDVLDAQSALTQARGQYVNALRDHSVARARLLRATGADVEKG